MLLKVHGPTSAKARSKGHSDGMLENMTITYFTELALFLQSISLSTGTFEVTYSPPDGDSKVLELSLEPDITGLEVMYVNLHNSPTEAYKMNKEVNLWFSSCLGYEVVLAYLGPHKRAVLGNLSPNAAQGNAKTGQSWLSSITASIPTMLGSKSEAQGITFADCAAYLVVTEESVQDVSSRFSDGAQMDVTKFRPNIVLSGSSKAYDEDYWGAITIKGLSETEETQETEIILTANCLRCVSLNVDYSTGQIAKGEAGTVLKKLMKDRRVDKGKKFSPVFGRYGFLNHSVTGQTIAVGDDVKVSKVNQERTAFGKSFGIDMCSFENADMYVEWPGLGGN